MEIGGGGGSDNGGGGFGRDGGGDSQKKSKNNYPDRYPDRALQNYPHWRGPGSHGDSKG